MDKFPPDQKIKNAKKKKVMESSGYEKTPRAKFQDPEFPTSQGDLGVLRIRPMSEIPRMTKAPTRTGDGLTNHVGAVGNVMSKAGFKL
jgi:hypothetical protein